ncbi:MAG: OmpA family protein [Bacteroidales bacterium]|nr:OmpA family protein [Bacteroidales bacterium]
MRDFKFISCILILALLPINRGMAQITNVEDLSARQLLKFGKNASRKGDVYTAIFFYEKYYALRKTNFKINYTLAELHRTARNYEKAKDLYEQVSKKAGKKYPLAQFYYAQMLKSTGDYDNAIDAFNKFRRSIRGEKESKEYSRIIRSEIEGCDSAKGIIMNPVNVSIESLNSTINGPHIELSPVPLNDTMFLYASLRIDSLVYFTDENVDTGMPVRQYYMAVKKGLDWQGGALLPEPINLTGVETCNGVLSRDGKRFYFTRCAKNWQGKVICGIYMSIIKDGIWQKPIPLPSSVNDPNYTATQPALGRTAKSDREIIYFVSDRPEGRGGMDLWYMVWDDKRNRYSKIRNLGTRVNTAGDEMTPFYDLPTRTLYFSSTGHPGIGGLDIFSVFGERRKWTRLKNIGFPLNTSYDDLYFTVSRSGEDGFLASNRPGGNSINNETCCDDLYYYRWNEFIRITVKATIYPFEKDRFGRKKDFSNFDFMNPGENIKPLDNAIIALYLLDKETNEYVFMERYTTRDDGIFYFNLQPDQDYQFKMEGFQYFDSEMYMSTVGFTFSDTIEMPPIWVNVMTDKPIVLENIYYEFNSAELNERSRNVLDTTLLVLLREAPEFIIEIGAHTDSIGETDYNRELSQQRADNVVSYLISKGISSEKLIAKGYGEEHPLAPNTLPDGSDNPAGREMNRRTEFRIVGTIGQVEEDEEVYDD